MSKRKIWTKAENEMLTEKYPNEYTENICALLGRSLSSVYAQAGVLGLKKSEAFRQNELVVKQGERLRKIGAGYRFDKGHVPENKGQKMPVEIYDKVKKTFFKKGHLPHNSKSEGIEVLRKDSCGKSYWMIKLPNTRKLVFKHCYIWQQANGEIPKGFNVIFKDGDQMNCVLENLQLVSNQELMYRNSKHKYPIEVIPALITIKKIKNKINEKQNV